MAAKQKRIGPTWSEATVSPLQIVPLDRWERVRHRTWRYPIHPRYLGTRAWTEIVDGKCYGAEASKINGWWLLWAERANATYTIAAISFMTRTCAVLISNKTGIVRRSARPMAEGMDPLHEILSGSDDAAWVWRRLSTVRTCEAALATFRERQAPKAGKRVKDGEAWLRRQLEGLGKSGSP